MPNLPTSVLDAALSQSQKQDDDALGRSIAEQAAPIRKLLFGGGPPPLEGLLHGLNLGQEQQPQQPATPAQPQQQQSSGWQLPGLDSLLSGLNLGQQPEPSRTSQTTPAPEVASARPQAVSGTPAAMPTGQPTSAQAAPSTPAPTGDIAEGDPQRFFATARPYAEAAERATGVPAALSLAIAANETGYGQKRYMAGPNNYHGIQASANDPNGVPYVDWRPGPNGEKISYAARQAGFSDPAAGFMGFARFLTDNPRYKPALDAYRQTGDVNQLAADIHQAGYAEDPQYTTKIQSIIKGIPVKTGVGEVTDTRGVGLQQPQSQATPEQAGNHFQAGSYTPNQINAATAEGLDYETALAVCGPAAAIAFARKTGRNPTMQEAVGLARQVGWTAAQGMAGPASQQRLLQSMGVAASLQDGAPDWRRVAVDVQRGNPVIISTPGHYFVAERYNPDDGTFDFGESAAVLKASGGRRWFKPDEIASLGMGAPRASLFMDSPESPSPSVVAGRSRPTAGASSSAPAAPPPPAGAPPAPAGDSLRTSLNEPGQGDTMQRMSLEQPSDEPVASGPTPTYNGRPIRPVEPNAPFPSADANGITWTPARNIEPYDSRQLNPNRNRAVPGGFWEGSGPGAPPITVPMSPEDPGYIDSTQYRQPLVSLSAAPTPTQGSDVGQGDEPGGRILPIPRGVGPQVPDAPENAYPHLVNPIDRRLSGERPYEVTDEEGLDRSLERVMAPRPADFVTNPYAVPDRAMYRQPLGDDVGVADVRGAAPQPYDPDQGPRESGYTLPASPSTYGDAGDEPQVPMRYTSPADAGSGKDESADSYALPVAPTPPLAPALPGASAPGMLAPTYGPPLSEAGPATPEPGPIEQATTWIGGKLKPIYDTVGNVVGYVQGAADAAYGALAPARNAAAALDRGKGYGQVTSTSGEPDYVETTQNPITRALQTPITPPERTKPLYGPFDLSDPNAFPDQESRNRFTTEAGAAQDVADIPYQVAEAGRQTVLSAAQSFADAIRAGQEGRPLAAAANALWAAIQVEPHMAGFSVAQRTVDEMIPEARIAGVGPGVVVGLEALLGDAIKGVNGLRNLPGALTPERLAAAHDLPGTVVRGAAAAVDRGIEAATPALEAARGLGSRVSEGLGANAERVAAADARMAAEGSTAAPGTLGVSPGATPRPAEPAPPFYSQLQRTTGTRWEKGRAFEPPDIVTVHSMDITPEMKRSVLEQGQPLFATPGQSPGIPGAGLGTRLAADVGSSLGSGTMGAAVGAGLPAETDEERRRNALIGAGVGMVAGPAASRLMRRGGGALSTFGMSPGEGGIRRSPPTVPGEPLLPGQRALPPGPGRTADDLIVAAHNAVGVPEKASPLEPGRLERWRQSFVRAWTDNRVDLAELQNDARRILGRPLSGEEMVYEASRVNPSGAAKVAIDDYVRPILTGLDSEKPVVSVTDRAGRTASLTETQVLSRMMELVNNRDIAASMGNPNRRFPGGLTGAESEQAARALLEKLPRETQVRIGQAANAISDTVDLYREKLVDAGVWTRQLGDQLKEQYPYWTPTKILDYMRDANNPGASTLRSISLNDRHLRQYSLAGTDKMREDGVASLIRYIQQAEEDIAKNRTFNAFAALRENVPGWSDLIREVKTTTPVESLKGEKAVTGFVDGERTRFIVPAPMAAAIQMEGAQHIPFVADVSRLFRELITRTPFFVAGQVPLDAASMIIRETAREGGPTPQNIARVTGALIGGYREAFRGLMDGTFHGDTAQYLRQGGGMAGYYQRSAQAASQALDDVSRRSMLQIRNQSDLGKTLKWLALQGPTQAVGERVELAPRTASYRLGMDRAIRRGEEAAAPSSALVPAEQAGAGLAAAPTVRGVDTRQANLTAMTGARDVTLDFQRGGNWAMVMNQAVPFSNVGIQSSVTPWRSFREKPAAYASTVVGLIGAPMLAAEAWNRADPQRARDYDDVPDYVKDRGIVVMTGQSWTDKQGNRHPYYALWQTRELSPFVIFGRELAGRALEAAGVGGQQEHRTWGSLLEGAISAASPIQANSAADAFSSATPLGASTGLQLALNRDFFRNRDIATERGDQEAGVIAQGAAKATGTRAAQWEFGLRDLTGNVGAAIMAGADLGANLLGQVPQGTAPKSLERTPVIGSVASRFEGSAIGNRLQRAQTQMMTPALQAALEQANMREDQATPVSNRYQNAQLRVDEQERWQRAFNAEIPLALAKARSSSEWANPGTRRQALRTALADAREAALKKALPGLTEGELNQRVIREHQGVGR